MPVRKNDLLPTITNAEVVTEDSRRVERDQMLAAHTTSQSVDPHGSRGDGRFTVNLPFEFAVADDIGVRIFHFQVIAGVVVGVIPGESSTGDRETDVRVRQTDIGINVNSFARHGEL